MSEMVENRSLVVPGDLIFKGRIRTGDNTYRNKGNVYATRIGLVDYGKGFVSVIALKSGYNPLVGDLVIGPVVNIELGYWVVNVDAPSFAVLNVPDAIDAPFSAELDMTKILEFGDIIVAKIVDMDRKRTPILSILGRGLGKVDEGFIIRLAPSKIPRLIGKKGSMITLLKKYTRCRIFVGQNGRIWIDGNDNDVAKVLYTIKKIENESLSYGLTNRIEEFLKKGTKDVH